jgi:hypothetical protein
MKIQKFEEHSLYDSMSLDFIEGFDRIIKESNEVNYNKIQNKVITDLKLNTELVLTFGTGIGTFYPIVYQLMEKMKIDSIELTYDKVVLLTICAITIIYIEEKKFNSTFEEDILRKDSKSMLEELKLMGIGNGIVKKLIRIFKSITSIFKLIGKHVGSIVGGFMDMFAYTAMLIPIMNGILYVIGKYDLNFDNFIKNFIGLSIGVGTIITKHGISMILNKLKSNNKIGSSKAKQIIDEIDTSVIHKVSDYNSGGEMITEQ